MANDHTAEINVIFVLSELGMTPPKSTYHVKFLLTKNRVVNGSNFPGYAYFHCTITLQVI